jgi:hypothetical protein
MTRIRLLKATLYVSLISVMMFVAAVAEAAPSVREPP